VAEIGTPVVQVAVNEVAELMVTESAATPANLTWAVDPVKKPVPVNSIELPLMVEAVTAGIEVLVE